MNRFYPGRYDLVLIAISLAIAIVSARPHAGGWNDGSRLATVESLVDYHTWCIDSSVFVAVPSQHPGVGQEPYSADDPDLLARGTGDKLFIDGHYYSDKSPVPAILMAPIYQVLEWLSGWSARENPRQFCYVMTLATSGVAYVLAVWSIYRLGLLAGLAEGLSLGLAVSFGLTTLALPYARHVNNHILLLGVSAALLVSVVHLAQAVAAGHPRAKWLVIIGTLAGLGYSIDLGAGPMLLVSAAVIVTWRCRRWQALALFVAAALPWLVLHHALNYHIGGSWKPANAIPEYFQWPGCSFDASNMTGGWNHGSVAHFLTYALALLFGKRGFIGHDLVLFLLIPAGYWLARKRTEEWPELLFAGGWSAATWIIYALTSTNSSGLCCSIRWFVPLLAPAFYIVAVFLREQPSYQRDFLVLSSWGAIMALVMWWQGPWMKHLVPFFWPIQGASLVSWIYYRAKTRQILGGQPIPDLDSDTDHASSAA